MQESLNLCASRLLYCTSLLISLQAQKVVPLSQCSIWSLFIFTLFIRNCVWFKGHWWHWEPKRYDHQPNMMLVLLVLQKQLLPRSCLGSRLWCTLLYIFPKTNLKNTDSSASGPLMVQTRQKLIVALRNGWALGAQQWGLFLLLYPAGPAIREMLQPSRVAVMIWFLLKLFRSWLPTSPASYQLQISIVLDPDVCSCNKIIHIIHFICEWSFWLIGVSLSVVMLFA